KEGCEIGAAARIQHDERPAHPRERAKIVECYIPASTRLVEPLVRIEFDRDRIAGRNHLRSVVRGNCRQHKQFWVKRATILCTAAYLAEKPFAAADLVDGAAQ